MIMEYPGEIWKEVKFAFEYGNDFRLQVSNFGRIRSFHKNAKNGNLLKGAMITGYRVLKLKFFKKRDPQFQQKVEFMQKQIASLVTRVKELTAEDPNDPRIKETNDLILSMRANLKKETDQDFKERMINYHTLFHRLVAEYFLPPPTPDEIVVAHLDHDKLNNRADNLKWMTHLENHAHQKTSPKVQADYKARKMKRNNGSRQTKLTVTQVMFLKKLLKEGKQIKLLAKQFKVSDMQIKRIQRGENWADIVI